MTTTKAIPTAVVLAIAKARPSLSFFWRAARKEKERGAVGVGIHTSSPSSPALCYALLALNVRIKAKNWQGGNAQYLRKTGPQKGHKARRRVSAFTWKQPTTDNTLLKSQAIRDVWAHNLVKEMDIIMDLVEDYPYIAMVYHFQFIELTNEFGALIPIPFTGHRVSGHRCTPCRSLQKSKRIPL